MRRERTMRREHVMTIKVARLGTTYVCQHVMTGERMKGQVETAINGAPEIVRLCPLCSTISRSPGRLVYKAPALPPVSPPPQGDDILARYIREGGLT